MPTPIQIIFDPISLGLLAIYGALILIEALTPGRDLTKIKNWIPRALIVFTIYFYLSTYLPLFWDKYFAQYQLFDISGLGIAGGTIVGLLVYQFGIYVWHRTMHKTDFLWRSFHQMHHSAERIDTFGAFYFSPLDMVGFTLVGSVSLVLIVGQSPQAATITLFINMFLGIFQHTNIKTPQWLGYIVQRPESHTIHHSKGIHEFNYSDLPIFDIIFGTFRNPKNYENEVGFYEGASSRLFDMLLFKDVSEPESR